jgi:predicted nucleic acid-binding protein
MNLMDADVCIDIIRDRPEAIAWMATVTEPLAVPGFVALELVIGSQDSTELRIVRQFLSQFPIIWASDADMNRALTDIAPLKLAHGIGGFDALIAATSIGQQMPLFTFNARHFRHVAQLQFVAP